MLGLILALISGLVFSVADAFRKHLSLKTDSIRINVWLHLLQLPILCFFFLFPVIRQFEFIFEDGYLLVAMPSIAANIAANYLFFRSLSISSMGLSIPYLSFTPVFTVIWGSFFLNELPTLAGMFGIILILIPALILPSVEEGNGIRFTYPKKGSLFMLAVAFFWSIAIVSDKLAIQKSSVSSHIFVLSFSATVFFTTALLIQKNKFMESKSSISFLIFLLTTILLLLALGLQFFALDHIQAAYVEAIKRGSSPLLSIIWGFLFFKEAAPVKKLLLGLIMSLGVMVLVLS
jgi:drug/metabolite transporter (DMT)-like permease